MYIIKKHKYNFKNIIANEQLPIDIPHIEALKTYLYKMNDIGISLKDIVLKIVLYI